MKPSFNKIEDSIEDTAIKQDLKKVHSANFLAAHRSRRRQRR